MRRSALLLTLGVAVAFTAVLAPNPAQAASHPAGVTYPLKAATIQPSGLAQSLPSTKRYVLVWQDQMIPDAYSPALVDWVVTHYVGTQKLFKHQIDDYRKKNPSFLMLVYHLAYGLNGADQTSPVGNITRPEVYGQEDTDTFTPWLAANPMVARESVYQHTGMAQTPQTRVSYPDPYWLMDIGSAGWRAYTAEALLGWCSFPTAKATGVFFDVAFPPWYSYTPANWWTQPAGGASRQALLAWWNPRATAYFDGLRQAFAPKQGQPRYLVIPNVDALVDGTDEPEFLAGTDGAFTENWQAVLANAGDWNLSARRIAKWATGAGKVWMADVTKAGGTLTQAERELLVGTYLLLRNGTSYLMIGNGDLTWWPEYELDLGWYQGEPPTDLEQLRVGGQGGAQGGLYARAYSNGVVLVNASAGALGYMVPSAMKRALWSGGGKVDANGVQVAQTLDYSQDVPAGMLSVPARSAIVLRSPAGAPPPGDEGPPIPPGDGGLTADGGGTGDGSTNGDGGNGNPAGGAGGCGCHSTSSSVPMNNGPTGILVFAMWLIARGRGRGRRRG
jgi:hypothetical protein